MKMKQFLIFLYGCKNFILAVALLGCVLLPDLMINFIMGSNRIFWNWISFLLIFLLCYGLTFLKKTSFTIFWICFFVLESIQFFHIAYFGIPIFPSAVSAIFHEYLDIFDLAYLKQVWFVIPVLFITYGGGLALFFFLSQRINKSKVRSFFIIIYALSLIVSDGLTARPFRLVKVLREQPNWILHRCLMKTPSNSLKSTIFTMSCTGIQKFLSDNSQQLTYKPYKITKEPSQTKNIVLIMGESVASKRMSLFGYHRKTTPNLDALCNDPDFLFKPSYSAAPSTKTSVMLFFNLVREPGNLIQIETGQNNLFRRAKLNGFKTFLITNNDGSRGIGSDIDEVRSSLILDSYPHASYPKILVDLKDKAFPQILKQLPLSDKNFIVLHMRSPHSPFEKNYENDKGRFCIYPEVCSTYKENISNTYDNCIVYLDAISKEILNSFKEIFHDKGESYLFFTADHAELLGDKDSVTGAEMYGHCHLMLPCVQVPFWVYGLNRFDYNFYDSIKKNSSLSAYEIGKLLLKLIGEKIENPNEEKDIFYITDSLLKIDRNNHITYKKIKNGDVKIVQKE